MPDKILRDAASPTRPRQTDGSVPMRFASEQEVSRHTTFVPFHAGCPQPSTPCYLHSCMKVQDNHE